MRTLAVATAFLAGVSVATAQSMTFQQYHKERGPCACPEDKDKTGSRCGIWSAFCEGSGIEIKNCYLRDVERRKRKECRLHWESGF
jgi:hypothetical protein